MELYLRRYHSEPTNTLGFMYSVDRTVECYTLEDGHRDTKVYGETRIPAGRYRLRLQHSPHFNQEMIYLEAVPDYTSIMIHAGTKAKDTLGCILVADTSNLVYNAEDTIANSSICLKRIQPLIAAWIRKEPTYITITDEDK